MSVGRVDPKLHLPVSLICMLFPVLLPCHSVIWPTGFFRASYRNLLQRVRHLGFIGHPPEAQVCEYLRGACTCIAHQVQELSCSFACAVLINFANASEHGNRTGAGYLNYRLSTNTSLRAHCNLQMCNWKVSTGEERRGANGQHWRNVY